MKSLSIAKIQREAQALWPGILNTQAPFASNPHEASMHDRRCVMDNAFA
jgi:hypothetical protein